MCLLIHHLCMSLLRSATIVPDSLDRSFLADLQVNSGRCKLIDLAGIFFRWTTTEWWTRSPQLSRRWWSPTRTSSDWPSRGRLRKRHFWDSPHMWVFTVMCTCWNGSTQAIQYYGRRLLPLVDIWQHASHMAGDCGKFPQHVNSCLLSMAAIQCHGRRVW